MLKNYALLETEWTDWSPCSVSCEGGIKMRTRGCVSKRPQCLLSEYQQCNNQKCPYIIRSNAIYVFINLYI